MEYLSKVILFLALASSFMTAQFTVPLHTGSAATSFGHYLDAACGSGSDSNSGTSTAAAWATLAHACSALSNDTTTLGVRYPDGLYRSVLAGTTLCSNGFLSYWPMMQHTCGTPSSTQVDDIFSGINGTLTGTGDGSNAPTWRTRGMTISSGAYANIPNYSNNISSQGSLIEAMVSKYPYSGVEQSGSYSITDGSGHYWDVFNPYNDGHVYFNMGSAALSYSQAPRPLEGQWNVWGLLCGGGNQYIYLNTTQEASATPGSCAFSYSNKDLELGYVAGNGGMTGVISGVLITPNTLSTTDYGTIQTWLSGTELPRLNRVVSATTPGLTSGPVREWNSYRVLGVNATCADVKTQIDALVLHGWLAAKYTIIQGPINWALTTRDGSGNLQTNTALCPMVGGQDGMKDLYDYAHSKGFTVVHYLTPSACSGITMPNSVGHETADAAQAAAFGADSIDYDSCTGVGQSVYQTMSTAMVASGRSMFMIVSNPSGGAGGNTVQETLWCQVIGANEIAATADPGPVSTWSDVSAIIGQMAQYGNMVWGQEKPYCWPWLENFAGVGSLTDNQGQTFTTLDAIFRSSMILSLDATSASTNNTITTQNKEINDLNDDVSGDGYGWQTDQRNSNLVDIFVRQLSGAVGNGAWFMAIANTDSSSHSVTINLTSDQYLAQMWGSYYRRDPWANWPSSCSTVTGGYSCGANLDSSPQSTWTVTVPAYYTQTYVLCNTQCTQP